MQAAVDAVVNNAMGYHKASKRFSVPQTTLERYVKKQKANPAVKSVKSSDPYKQFKCVFSKNQEDVLVNYLVYMKDRLFGLNSTVVRLLAFQIASRSGREHPFNKEEKLAGMDWFFGFHRRHPELSLTRKADVTSLVCNGRAGLSKASVDKFYDILEDLKRQGFTADRIYNSDEVSITVHPNNRSRVKKGRRQIAQDRGHIVTAEICFSASGTYVPPMLVFPSDETREEFEKGLPAGAWAQVNSSGFFNKDLFMEWFKKFVVFSRASKDNPVALLVDGLNPHTKNLDLLDYADEHGVTILCFPALSLPRLQPIDVSFMKSMSTHYEEEVRSWLQTNPGKMVTSMEVSVLFGSAYLRASSVSVAVDGFVSTGVWPVIRLAVFHDDDFSAGAVVEVEVNDDEERLEKDPLSPVVQLREDKPRKTYSRHRAPAGSKAILPFRESSTVIPILKSHNYRPHRSALEGTNDGCKIEKKDCVENTVSGALEAVSPKSDSRPHLGDSQDNYDPQCLYCNDFYSATVEGWWIRCAHCLRWAHHFCAGFDGENDDVSCHICKACA